MFYSLAIGIYRRRISPYKGFKCASARINGGVSCSMAIEAILREHGMWRGLPLIRTQLDRCRTASVMLAEQANDNDADPNTPKRRKQEKRGFCGTKKRNAYDYRAQQQRDDCCETIGDSACYSGLDDAACGIEAGDLACAGFDAATEAASNCEIGSCEVGSCDVGSCDFS
jgi:putative component of membrane protein insertase Oxa1/YidC/SpoIIIJ protein YidD